MRVKAYAEGNPCGLIYAWPPLWTEALALAKSKEEIEKLDEYVRGHPNEPEGYLELAKAHREGGNAPRAREVLDRLLKSSETEGKALLMRAELLAEEHDWIGALRDIKGARRSGVRAPLRLYLRVAYLKWLLLANEGWRPEALSRYMTLGLSLITGALMLYMSVGVLMKGGYIGALLVFLLGLAFIWAGLAIGGISLWLKKLQDRIEPGWDIAIQKSKTKKRGG
jgi:hypothetical protein